MAKFNYEKNQLYQKLASMFPYERTEDVKSFVKDVPTNYNFFNKNQANVLDYIVQIEMLKQNESLPRARNLKDLTSMVKPQIEIRESYKFGLKKMLDLFIFKMFGYVA